MNAKEQPQLLYEHKPDAWRPVLDVSVVPSFDQDPTLVGVASWLVTKYSVNQIEMEVTYENPLHISFEEEPDILEITFSDENLFISTDGIQIKERHRTLVRKL